jgi:hypothetical protein
LDQFNSHRYFCRGVIDFRRAKFSNRHVLFSDLQDEGMAPHTVSIVVIYILDMATGAVWERWYGKHLRARSI